MLATQDPDVYSELWRWAKDNEHSAEIKVRLFDVLVRNKPRAGKAKTRHRDANLRMIAVISVSRFSSAAKSQCGH